MNSDPRLRIQSGAQPQLVRTMHQQFENHENGKGSRTLVVAVRPSAGPGQRENIRYLTLLTFIMYIATIYLSSWTLHNMQKAPYPTSTYPTASRCTIISSVCLLATFFCHAPSHSISSLHYLFQLLSIPPFFIHSKQFRKSSPLSAHRNHPIQSARMGSPHPQSRTRLTPAEAE